jgi:hypothetical protein
MGLKRDLAYGYLGSVSLVCMQSKEADGIHLSPVYTSFDVFPKSASLKTMGYFPGCCISIEPTIIDVIISREPADVETLGGLLISKEEQR